MSHPFNKKPVVLELFSGQGSVSKSVEALGGRAFRVDWSDSVEAELHQDIRFMDAEALIRRIGEVPVAVWASPQCTTYSIATHRHRTASDGYKPKTTLAVRDDITNRTMWRMIDRLCALGMKYYFVENPRGRMRHMPFVAGRPRCSITYCSYGNRGTAAGFEDQYVMKPTDIWTNHPDPQFRLPCTTTNPPHVHGRFDLAHKRDYLSRGSMPPALTGHIARLTLDLPVTRGWNMYEGWWK